LDALLAAPVVVNLYFPCNGWSSRRYEERRCRPSRCGFLKIFDF
ncbi:uncharacterized, partial [Tachysurus ichikawai]